MKKNSLWLRVLALTMALLMTVAVLAACSANEEKAVDEGTDTQAADLEGTENPEDVIINDALGDDLNFDRDVRILGEDSQKNHFWQADDSSPNPVRVTVYKRNQTVEDRLGIEFKWDFEKGDWGNRNTFMQKVETMSETDPYDAMICYNLVPYMLAQNGLCANLYGDNYLDLTAPWWPQSQLSEVLVNDTLYGVSASNGYGLLANMMAMFFNNELLEKRNLESPYDLVKNNEWTIDKLAEMIKDTYEDANANGKADKGDIFGFSNATNAKRDAWFFALGYKYAEVRDGQIVSLVDGDSIQKYIDKMVEFYDTKDIKLYDDQQTGLFKDEQVYFYSGAVMTAEVLTNANIEINYGVVPLPKLNAQQDRYYTHLSNTYDTVCVPTNVKDMECSSAVLECLASEAYKQIGPMYFETYLKLRYAPDERLAEMYDLVRDSVTFDLIYLYSIAYPNANNPKDGVKNCITDPKSNSWSSVYASNKDVWSTSFANIVKTYEKTN